MFISGYFLNALLNKSISRLLAQQGPRVLQRLHGRGTGSCGEQLVDQRQPLTDLVTRQVCIERETVEILISRLDMIRLQARQWRGEPTEFRRHPDLVLVASQPGRNLPPGGV